MTDIVNPGQATGGPINAGAMPSNYDLEIYKGDLLTFTITLKDSLSVPVDISSSTPSAQIRIDYNDPSPIDFICTMPNGGTDGLVEIKLSSAVTATLFSESSYIWDFQMTDSSGENRTYLTGDILVHEDVTR